MKKNLILALLVLGFSIIPQAEIQAQGLLRQLARAATGNNRQATTQQQPAQATTAETAPDGPTDGLFPYDKQQFTGRGVYLDGTEKVENFVYYLYVQFADILTKNEGYRKAILKGCCPVCPGGKVVAYGEPVVNAFFYDYMQKPDDYKNFRQMIKGYIVAYNYAFGFVVQNMVDGSQTQMIDSEGNTQTLWENEADRCARNYQLMRAAEELAMQSDYQNIFEGTYSIYTQAEKAYKEGNKVAAYNNYRELEFAWNYFLTKHPKWTSDDRAKQFTQMYDAAMQRRSEIRLAVIDENKVAQDMPKTYKAIPGVEAKVRMCIGREDPEHKNAPVLFLSSGWRPLYKSGTSIIDQRAVDVGWTYTDAKGQKWLAYTTLMQKAVYHGLTVQYVDSYMFSGGFKTMKLK